MAVTLRPEEFMERALERPQGIEAHFSSMQDARRFRMRCYKARKTQREKNKRIYPPDQALYGASQWDEVQMVIEDHQDYVVLRAAEEPIYALSVKDTETGKDLDMGDSDGD